MLLLLICYNITLYTFYIPVCIFSFVTGNKPLLQRLGIGAHLPSYEQSIWLHAASVGEVNALKYLIPSLRSNYPQFKIILSTITISGRGAGEKSGLFDSVILLPFENIFVISKLIKQTNTKLFIVVESEIWPNLICSASKYCKLILLNARMSDKSYRIYSFIGFYIKYLLSKFDFVLCKSEDDKKRYFALTGRKDIITMFNIKNYLNFPNNKDNKLDTHFFSNFALAASTHEGEELFFCLSCRATVKKFNLVVVAPRHLNRVKSVVRLLQLEGFNAVTLDDYLLKPSKTDVVVIDRFGLLEDLYCMAERIFVGGSFAHIGGHNIFEALKYGKVISVGPNMENFSEVMPLCRKYNVVDVVHDNSELTYYLNKEATGDFEGFRKELFLLQEKSYSEILRCVDRCILS